MALIREREIHDAARRALGRRVTGATARQIFTEQADPRARRYDIFLSHSIRDANIVLGAKQILEEHGNSVYVDWIEDPLLDRSSVNQSTAVVLRARMEGCNSLLYLHTKNSSASKWMPWELGFFDGHNGNVAIFPIIGDRDANTFQGQEYLGLYPYVDMKRARGQQDTTMWIHKSRNEYLSYRSWKDKSRSWNRLV